MATVVEWPRPREASTFSRGTVRPYKGISPRLFYGNYHGHTIKHLEDVYPHIRGDPSSRKPIIWLAGDSSLDNKAWLEGMEDAIGGLRNILSPPRSMPDVAHQLNRVIQQRGLPYDVVNTAVEESTIGERSAGRSLKPQDEFLRDHLQPQDVLIVSVGGNDVALRPSLATIVNMAILAFCMPRVLIASGWAPGLGHFQRMYQRDAAGYLSSLTSKCKPTHTMLCTIYYPDERPGGSWAETILSILGYNRNPAHLQTIIRAVHEHGTTRVRVPGLTVTPVAFHEALDGKRTEDYVARVEPSAAGGARMATLLLDTLQRLQPKQGEPSADELS
jgi:hypothetical protein